MKLKSYGLFKEIILMFSCILVVSTGYILLISICAKLKAGKLYSIASSAILTNLFKNYFKKGCKNVVAFAQLFKSYIDCFVLEISTVYPVSIF